MDIKDFVTKITSLTLVFTGFYQIFLSLNAVFFIYPSFDQTRPSFTIQEGLIEKALLLYATMISDSIYGLALLFKPSQEVKTIHVIIGILLAVFSIFFITQTPFTVDPIFNFLKGQVLK